MDAEEVILILSLQLILKIIKALKYTMHLITDVQR